MIDGQVRKARVAIIGAGWMGLGCLRELKERGHEVDVYEKLDDVGGVWHPSNNYANLKIHNPASTIEYFDYPLPENINRDERLPSAQIHSYLKNYVDNRSFRENINFSHTVTRLDYDTVNDSIKLFSRDAYHHESLKMYDYVINTNGFSNRHLPKFSGSDCFQGEILHSFEANQKRLMMCMSNNKNITIVGGSKTATDIIYYLASHGYKATWLYRDAYWFSKYRVNNIPLNKRMTKIVFTKVFSFINRFIFRYYNNQKVIYILFRMLGILHTFGDKKHFNLKKFHLANIKPEEMKVLTIYNNKYGVKGEISCFEPDGIRLEDGRFIKTDVVICCTGSGSNSNEIAIKIDGKDFSIGTVKKVYRCKVIPAIPRLIFTGYHSFTTGIVNSLMQGKWVAKYIDRNLSSDYLDENAMQYPHHFFEKPPLFNSDIPLIVGYYAGLEQYFKSGEIDKEKYCKWLVDCYTNSVSAHHPYPI